MHPDPFDWGDEPRLDLDWSEVHDYVHVEDEGDE